jgi:tripartite-type tricarboxylate transporter receptor subunit TctC
MKSFSLGRCLSLIGFAFGMVAMPSPVAAQFPDRTVQLVVPVGPGGGTDLLARQIAKKLSEVWGQPVVVENKTGGGGIIGAEAVIRSAPDGYTLLLSHDAVITATPVLYKRPDFDPAKQLAPISQLATIPYVVVVNPSVPAKDIPELIALMKERTAKNQSMGFATSALGSADHLSGELFKIAAGVDMLVVPYKSTLPAMSDVIAGHLPMGFFSIPASQPHVKAGTLRALGITSSTRSKLLPDLPTVAESLPGFVTGAWYGLWAPAGTPAAIVEKISSDVRRIAAAPDIAAYMLSNGFEAATSTPAEFAEFIRKDSAKTAQVIKSANVRLE